MAQELPGFYFDAELNRYFPLSRKRGRSGTTVSGAASSSSTQDDNKQGSGDVQGHGLNPSILHLLQARETNSGMSRGSCGEQGFQTHYFESQAAHPQVWEYDKTRSLADGALQQLRVTCQTVEGERDADILVLGGSTGLFQLRGTTLLDGIQPSPSDIVRPRRLVSPDGVTRSEREPPGLWSVMDGSQFSSRITAIKRLGQEEAAQPQQSAIMTTLGAGKVCGSLYVLDFKQGPEIQEWDRNCLVPFQVQRRVKSPCSVWTAEASPNGIAASLGMDSGAGLVALERSDVTWLCRSGSAVLSQQFDKQGNILLCGFRNGAISTIDLRKPAPKEATSHHEAAALKSLKNQQRSHSFGNGKHSNKRRVDDYFCSHSKIMRMGSAVCSILLLQNDENYLLASAMNGVIEQWDRRMVENGAVRTYEGHNNTHTTLQLAVDPTETLLVSGGEDCALRIWSLASGRLLHSAKNLSSPASCICWPAMMRVQRKGRYWEEPPFESNFSWGFWFGSSSGLHYMHGAGSEKL